MDKGDLLNALAGGPFHFTYPALRVHKVNSKSLGNCPTCSWARKSNHTMQYQRRLRREATVAQLRTVSDVIIGYPSLHHMALLRFAWI